MPDIHRLTIESDGFRLDGAPFRFIAGAIHYFRVPRAYWRDRLLKLKACGFNAVETYVAWNAHQPTEDAFVYDDMLDIVEFLKTAQELGLYAIVRHPMYSTTILLFLAMPLVLGSLISFVIFLMYPFIIAKRIKGEEEFLEKELKGYCEYKKKVKYRLIPIIW